MTYMCNKCMGHLLNVRSLGGGGGGGVRRQELTQLHFIFFLIL